MQTLTEKRLFLQTKWLLLLLHGDSMALIACGQHGRKHDLSWTLSTIYIYISISLSISGPVPLQNCPFQIWVVKSGQKWRCISKYCWELSLTWQIREPTVPLRSIITKLNKCHNINVLVSLFDQYVKMIKICLQIIIHICVIKGGKPYLESYTGCDPLLQFLQK